MKDEKLEKIAWFIGNAFVVKSDVPEINEHNLHDWESMISLEDLGSRGNFTLYNRQNGKIIKIQDGLRCEIKEK